MNSAESAETVEQPRPKRRRVRRTIGFVFRSTRNLLAVLMLAELAMVFTPVTERIYSWLSVATSNPGKADYILCLGGGAGREAMAAQLWHQKVAPTVVVSNAPGAAEWMRLLVTRCGVPRQAVVVDNTSYTTGEHPGGIARLKGIDPARQSFVIVTDNTHTRRARDCFAKAGYAHIIMYAGKEAPHVTFYEKVEWRVMVIPSIVYEAAAMTKYRWQGKI